ncbi:MAG: hypothetical protein IJB13_05855, partial [Clostridia bacterium]|nr:hypothetical protein [Clostridia bacterium]
MKRNLAKMLILLLALSVCLCLILGCGKAGASFKNCGTSGNANQNSNTDNAHDHVFSKQVINATCTREGSNIYTCTCGDYYVETIPALGHDYKNGVCSVCSKKDPTYHTHIWEDATCIKPQTCECGQTQGEPLNHAVVVDYAIEPTCTKSGLTEGSHCIRCNTTL